MSSHKLTNTINLIKNVKQSLQYYVDTKLKNKQDDMVMVNLDSILELKDKNTIVDMEINCSGNFKIGSFVDMGYEMDILLEGTGIEYNTCEFTIDNNEETVITTNNMNKGAKTRMRIFSEDDIEIILRSRTALRDLGIRQINNANFKLINYTPLYVDALFSKSNLKFIDNLTLSSNDGAVNCNYMFCQCSNLKKISNFNAHLGSMNSMFLNCTRIVEIGPLDSKDVTNMSRAFDCCPRLERIEELNVSSLTSANLMFDQCDNLNYIKLISDDASKIELAVAQLITHSGAAANDYIIDLSSNTSEVLNNLTNLARDGWTIIK
jgi:hypothetical protein